MRTRILAVLALVLLGCGSPTDPGTPGEIKLIAEVVRRERWTCEYRVTADASRLTRAVAWASGWVEFSGTDGTYGYELYRYYWRTVADSVRPGDLLQSRWLGHGGQGPWRATVTWEYEGGGMVRSASATFDCR